MQKRFVRNKTHRNDKASVKVQRGKCAKNEAIAGVAGKKQHNELLQVYHNNNDKIIKQIAQ